MIDRLLSGALNTVILTLITLLAGAGLVCAYTGMLHLLDGQGGGSMALLGTAAATGISAALMIRYHNDLVDR